jgi:hypothetical protein
MDASHRSNGQSLFDTDDPISVMIMNRPRPDADAIPRP